MADTTHDYPVDRDRDDGPPQPRARRQPPRPPVELPLSPRVALVAILLVVAILIGGSAQPITGMIIELLGLAVIAQMLALTLGGQGRDTALGWITLLLASAVGAYQLTPLPAALWHGLPNRQIVIESLQTIGAADAERTVSLDPGASLRSLLALLPGIAMLLFGLVAHRREARLLTTLVIVMATLSALLGALQISGGTAFYPYSYTHFGFAVGLFANRNHEADLLLVALVLLAGKYAATRRQSRSSSQASRAGLALGLGLLLVVATATTGSRMGTAILPFALAGGLLLQLVRCGGRVWLLFATVAAVVVIGALVEGSNPAILRGLDQVRGIADDPRFTFWPQVVYAIKLYWPVGSGLGTFVPIYAAIEPLDALTPLYVVAAHNEYLQILLELGLVGALLIATYLLALFLAIVRARWIDTSPERAAATLAVAILLVHSLADFPMRTPSLMAVFGLLNGLVLRTALSKGTARHVRVPE